MSGGALALWYEKPAEQWIEALPVGNGRLGAMVFGGVARERLQLNEDTLWAGRFHDPNSPEALAALPEVRRLIFAGKYREAHELVGARMLARPIVQMPYQTLGELVLEFPALGRAGAYRRELDLDLARARTTFESGGARFTRDVIASAVDQVIAVRLSADAPARITTTIALATPLTATASHDAGALVVRGTNLGMFGVESGLAFEARVQVVAEGGQLEARDGAIVVSDADAALVLIAAATNYRRFDDLGGDPAALTAAWIAAARAKSYEQLLADHVADHQRLFRRVSIDLGRTEAALRPTDERVRRSQTEHDPDLAALYFQYGRYLLLSCSRPGTQPANLQGLWNDLTDPPWGCKYTININTEMNYWPAEPANLPECVEPLVCLLEDLAVRGAETARVCYGARGWVAHHNTDLWRACAPVDGPQWGMWPTGGAWLCTQLWDHFDYGRDRAFLARAYPILRGAAEFFLDTLVPEPAHGWLVTCPSLSPENEHPFGTSICAGPTLDAQILRDLFTQCLTAAELLDVDPAFREALRAARARLPPNQIGAAGQLQEWLEDWDLQAPEIHHRHVSHLYGLYPSSQITIDGTPELAAAARRSLEIRGDDATGWGIAWRLNLWARLGDGEHAHQILRLLLGPERTYPNLFDAHPPFQIDGNFGGVSGIAEMLVQGHEGVIRLLPALPGAWPEGRASGLRVRGGFTLDLAWTGGRLASADVRGPGGARARLRYGRDELTVELDGSGRARAVFQDETLRAG